MFCFAMNLIEGAWVITWENLVSAAMLCKIVCKSTARDQWRVTFRDGYRRVCLN